MAMVTAVGLLGLVAGGFAGEVAPAAGADSGTMDCPVCAGAGKTSKPCAECKRTGSIPCAMCKKGIILCPDCDGLGKVRGSMGVRTAYYQCQKCKGIGKFACPECRVAEQSTGKKTCPTCNGAKDITSVCARCNGTGKLVAGAAQTTKAPEPGTKAALELQARQAQLKLQLIALQEQIEAIKKQLAEVEAQLAQPAAKPRPAEPN
jgi:DnaJ-class molecular chaperone